eukprot:1713121-Rhodomonas_salina.5
MSGSKGRTGVGGGQVQRWAWRSKPRLASGGKRPGGDEGRKLEGIMMEGKEGGEGIIGMLRKSFHVALTFCSLALPG